LPAKAWTDAALAPTNAEKSLKSDNLAGAGVRIIILGAGAAGIPYLNKMMAPNP
jgi:hypothetical protein